MARSEGDLRTGLLACGGRGDAGVTLSISQRPKSMREVWRLLLCVVVFGTVLGGAAAQGSASSFGRGGGFGGGGGRLGDAGGAVNTEETRRGQRLENTLQLPWNNSEAILTPGDRVEYRQTLKKDEVLFATVASDTFDAALTIEDGDGKVLAKNDDREEGDQSPLLIFIAPADGTYKLKVLSYRSAAGGKFTVRTAKGRTIELTSDTATLERSSDDDRFIRIRAKKGEVLDLQPFRGVDRGWEFQASDPVIGPTGVAWRDYRLIRGERNPLILCDADGDYLIRYRLNERATLRVPRVAVSMLTPGGTVKLNLEPGEKHLVRMPVEAGQRLWTELAGPAGATVSVTPNEDERTVTIQGPDETFQSAPGLVTLVPSEGAAKPRLRLFLQAGTFNYVVQGSGNGRGAVEVRTRTEVEDLPEGAAVRGTLAIGESRVFLLKSRKSELMHLEAKSATFRPRIDIVRLDGIVANSLIATPGRSAADALYFPNEETFLVRVCAQGHGGSGSYEIQRKVYLPTDGKFGKTERVALSASTFGLFGFDLEANKRYEVVVEGGSAVDLLSADGELLQSQVIDLGGVRVHYFVPRESGRYRLWLRGDAPAKVQMRPTVVPKLDG